MSTLLRTYLILWILFIGINGVVIAQNEVDTASHTSTTTTDTVETSTNSLEKTIDDLHSSIQINKGAKETIPSKAPADTRIDLADQRQFDTEQLEAHRNDPAFDYTEEKEKKKKKEKKEEENLDLPDFGLSKEALEIIGQILLYSLLGMAVFFIILRLFNSNFRQLFSRRKVQPVTVNIFEELPEDVNIHELNFNSLLEDAVKNKQYRKAVRIHYLQALKKLTDRELIDWKLDKTNADYMYEIHQKQPTLVRPFSNITRLFDYIWYGNFEIDENSYQQVDRTYNAFNQSVKAFEVVTDNEP